MDLDVLSVVLLLGAWPVWREWSSPQVLVAGSLCLLTWACWRVYLSLFHSQLKVLRKLRAQGVPGYPFRPYWGTLPELIQMESSRVNDPALAAATDASYFYHESTRKLAGSFQEGRSKFWSFQLGREVILVAADPDAVRQILVSHADSTARMESTKEVLSITRGGLLLLDGDMWRRQRRLINPAFSMREIKRMFATIAKSSAKSIANLHDRVVSSKAAAASIPGQGPSASSPDPVLMDKEFGRLALEVVSKAALGLGLDGVLGTKGADVLFTALQDYFVSLFYAFQLSVIIPAYRYLPTPLNWKVISSKRIILNAVERIVRARLADHNARLAPSQQSSKADVSLLEAMAEGHKESPTNLLDLLINATEPADLGADVSKKGTATPQKQEIASSRNTGTVMSKQQLIVETITFIAAGSETTATLLTWTMMLLSMHPEWQEKAREEVLSLWKQGSQGSPKEAWCPTFDEIGEMKVCGWILNETLRLYPPVPMVGRLVTDDIQLSNGLVIPAGCSIYCSIQMMQQNKEFWGSDADEFRPDRFANGVSKATSNPGAFIPFGIGPRVCIGQNFAVAEAKVVLALLLSTFSWRLADSYKHHPELFVTIKAKYNMPFILEPLQS